MSKFNNLETARSFQALATKTVLIVLGDDGLFWACAPATAARLVAAGHEYA